MKWRLGVAILIFIGDKAVIARKVGSTEWQLPAGGKSGSETVIETAAREFKEELMADISIASDVKISFLTHEYEFPAVWKEKRGCFGQRQFIAIIELPPTAKLTPDGHELEEIRLVEKNELLNSLTHESMKAVIKEMVAQGEIIL